MPVLQLSRITAGGVEMQAVVGFVTDSNAAAAMGVSGHRR